MLQISLGYTANFRLVWVQNEISRRRWKERKRDGRGREERGYREGGMRRGRRGVHFF